ncbi:MAG: ferric reductase-like transmembrane domain-containing protein [Streptosporangiales bacterium]|nr:ferric reductase-like transmembrane domain-containing protein [Streptosporangiales bacterium]MBO0889567.1 ferric reductase-like transmembrane domain-containing protein [Acidothermales bacterium]
MLHTLAGNPLWYLTRATGVVALVALTLSVALGVATLGRVPASLPRFVTQGVHRAIALTAVGALLVHVATVVLDGYVPIGWWAVVVPFVSGYHPFWVGLGAAASDLVLLAVATSLLRRRMRYRTWRVVHLATYPAWLLALLHYVGVGTDARGHGGLLLVAAGVVVVLVAVVVRLVLLARASVREARA